jgi:hypothetical protein
MTDEVTRFEIAKLELREGDKLVVRTELILSKEQVAYITERLQPFVPDNEIIVLTAGLTLDVLRRTEQ